MHRKILLAGATGAIGRRLCPLLIADGWHVTGMTRSEDKASALAAAGVEPVVADVFDPDLLLRVFEKSRPDMVIHQLTDLPAGLDQSKMAEALERTARLRETGTRNLIQAARASGIQRMIVQSITLAYKPGGEPHPEEDPLGFDNPFFQRTVEAVASMEQQTLEAPFDGIVLRYGKLYGPGTGFDRPFPGGPVHVDAAADAARLSLTRGEKGIYNIAENDGFVCIEKAVRVLGWDPGFRIGP